MKRLFHILIISALFTMGLYADTAKKAFPKKPITILVYTGPGGLIDITARKFATIAKKYTDATFVVKNSPGSGGIVAIKKLLQQPADGYTLFASTKSNISKIVASGVDTYIDALDWSALMLSDPECVITNKTQKIHTWEQIVQDAREKNGSQLWLGPAKGGLDHVTAMKIWDKAGIKARWIPFKSGGKAKAALLGNQGVAYVGNPGEVLGNDKLMVAAICADKRLKQFPDVPVFKELGVEGVENEVMWRGFVLKKGVPQKIRGWYDDLFKKVANDPEWKNYWQPKGIDVTYISSEKFTKIVKEDKKQFEYYLKKLGIVKSVQKSKIAKIAEGRNLLYTVLVLLLLYILIGLFVYKKLPKEKFSRIMIPVFLILFSILLYLITYTFPTGEKVGPAVVPRLWVFIIIPLSLYLLFDIIFKDENKIEKKKSDVSIVVKFTILLILYLIGIVYIGYFISSFLFVSLSIYLLGYRKIITILSVSFGWLIFSYFVFYKLLYVPLPLGKLIEGILR